MAQTHRTATSAGDEQTWYATREVQCSVHDACETYLLECGASDDWIEDSVDVLAHVLDEHRVSGLHGPLHGSDCAGGAHAHHLQVVFALPLLDPHYALKSEPTSKLSRQEPGHTAQPGLPRHIVLLTECMTEVYICCNGSFGQAKMPSLLVSEHHVLEKLLNTRKTG